jgi:hypothetical protein
MAKHTSLTARDFDSIAEGRAKATKGPGRFVSCTRRGGRLVLECGWIVPEADSDDPGSSTDQPFRDGMPTAWVGRRLTTDDPDVALATFDEWKGTVLSATPRPLGGERIGSVYRGEG